MPTPPALTQEQRQAAYNKSLELRRERAELKRWLSGDGPGPDWSVNRLRDAFASDAAQGMKVYDLLRALPGVGDAKARQLLEQAGIPLKNAVRTCGERQVQRLFQLLQERNPGH